MRRWLIAQQAKLILAFVPLMLCGCSASEVAGERPTMRRTGPSPTTPSSPPSEGVAERQASITAALDRLARLTLKVDRLVGATTRTCMARSGFPQLKRAHSASGHRSPLASYQPLDIHPLELGPTTTAQARRFGVIGVSLAFREPESPTVVSRNRQYDRAYAKCHERGQDGWVGSATRTVSRAHDLMNGLRRAHLATSEAAISDLLKGRLKCVRREGYGEVRPREWLGDKSLEDLLRSVGVTPGVEFPGTEPMLGAVANGDITIVYPRRAARYVPSPSEVKFAVVYVRCGERLGFRQELKKAQLSSQRSQMHENAAGIRHLVLLLREWAGTKP